MVRSAVSIAVVGFLALFSSSMLVAHWRRDCCQGLEQETLRIQGHLERVEHELQACDVSHLMASQRAARERNISALRDYRLRGRFPHNHDFRACTPYFVDRHGTRCAMAYLIERSGGGALVRRVATTANNARVGELAQDRDLLAWLDQSGLTLAEAARIQPEYGGGGPESEDWQPLYGVATVCASTLAVSAIVMSEQEPSEMSPYSRRDRGGFALATGLVCLGVGIPGINAPDDAERGLGALNLAIGFLATAVGIAGLTGADAHEDEPAPLARWSLAPVSDIGQGGAAFVLRF